MNDFPTLKSKNCVMNRIAEDDIPVMRQIFDDKLTKKYLPELRALVRTDKGIQQMLSSFDAYLTMNEGMIWAVRLRDVMIGFVAIMDLSYNPTIIYAMHPNYRRNGYMKECVGVVVKYMLNNTRCHYIQSEVYKENYISVHLLQTHCFEVLNQNEKKVYLRRDLG